MALRTGKLPPTLLKRLLEFTGADDPRVLLGPKVGEDAALVRLGEHTLVLKTDPVTYAADMIGWYAVHVNANDVATRGAVPAWFQSSILLPEGSDENLAEDIFKQISEAAKGLGVAVTGGHTEVTPGIDRPIVVGDMHGVLTDREPVLTSSAKEGDAIVLTKGAGIEGTALIAREKRDELVKELEVELVERASNFLIDPGLSVVREAMLALEYGVHSMHDPTEGGVSMGLEELALASGKSVEITLDDVIVRPETNVICMFYGIEPLGLLGSGALLATFESGDADEYVRALRTQGIDASIIGKITGPGERSVARKGPKIIPFSSSERDEVLKVL